MACPMHEHTFVETLACKPGKGQEGGRAGKVPGFLGTFLLTIGQYLVEEEAEPRLSREEPELEQCHEYSWMDLKVWRVLRGR